MEGVLSRSVLQQEMKPGSNEIQVVDLAVSMAIHEQTAKYLHVKKSIFDGILVVTFPMYISVL
jgi:hypothetical protein